MVVGGGHNALVAASYLARAGRRVSILEARSVFGGAVAGSQPFAGVDVTLSRFAYLVSLLPDRIRADLGLNLELRSRTMHSYSPTAGSGLAISRTDHPATAASFAALAGGSAEYERWLQFHQQLATLATVVEPTLTGPLPSADAIRRQLGDRLWNDLTQHPIGAWIGQTFDHDLVRGLILTDALIGTLSSAMDPTLRQNRCFLYHVIGNGTGEWKVPVGGMAAVAREFTRVATQAGADLVPQCRVVRIEPRSADVMLVAQDGTRWYAEHVLAGCAPAELAHLLGEPVTDGAPGAQIKVNLVLDRLPRLASGVDPRVGFSGTLHVNQGWEQLQAASTSAAAGRLPVPLPCEVYCQTLTDRSVLGPVATARGRHALTVFGLQAPAEALPADPEAARDAAAEAVLASLNTVLAEPIESCLSTDSAGHPCLEVLTPMDLERELQMPKGNIFHGDLTWPWWDGPDPPRTPAERWGVESGVDRVMLCGSGARRGGAVSGIAGHNAAMAALEAGW